MLCLRLVVVNNHVPIVDPMRALAAQPRHGLDRLVGEVDLDDVGVHPRFDLVANQTRRHRIDVSCDRDRAPLADGDDDTRVLRHAARRQRLERGTLLGDSRFVAPMKTLIDDALDEAHVRVDAREITTAAQQERLHESALEQMMGLLDHAILVRFPGLDARRLKAMMNHDVGKPPRQRAPPVFASSCVAAERLSCRMRSGTPPSAPQRALEALHERLEGLRERELDEPPPAVGEHELEEQVHEHRPGDGNAKLRRVREVQRRHASR